MMFHKVKNAGVLEDFLLAIEFVNGTEKRYDVKPLFDKFEEFRALESVKGLFAEVKVDRGGFGISWNDDIDLACEELWCNGNSIND